MQFPFVSSVTALLGLALLAPICSAQPKKEKEPASSETLEIGGKTLQEWIAEIPSTDRSKGENAIRTVLLFGPDRAYEALPVISRVISTHTPTQPLDISIRVNAALALGIIIGSANQPDQKHVQDAVLMLTRLLGDREAIVRYRAAEALGRIGPAAKPAMTKLLEIIDDPTTWETRQAVATALGLIAVDNKNKIAPPVEVQSALFKRLYDPASRVRLAAIQSLTYLGSPANPVHKENLVNALMQVAFKDSDASIRIWSHMAIMGSTQISDKHIIEIGKMLAHKDMMVRAQAAQALGTIGPKAKIAVPPLIKTLDDREDSVVLYSIWALSRMELWGKPAVPALQLLANDPNEVDFIKRAAVDAVTAIQGTPLTTPLKKS